MLAKISRSGSNVDLLSGAIARRNATTFVTSFFLNFQMSDILTDIILYLKIHSYAK